jgi:hypothetical protein
MQDQVANPVGVDGATQQAPRTQDPLLPDEILKAAGAHAIR